MSHDHDARTTQQKNIRIKTGNEMALGIPMKRSANFSVGMVIGVV